MTACLAVISAAAGFAAALWTGRQHAPPPAAASPAAAARLRALLAGGTPAEGGPGYFEQPSPALAAAADGASDRRFYQLGELLVRDGMAGTIINLSREMNGSWYEWSEQRAPPGDPAAFIRAWRRVVTVMRSVPGQHFRFLWTVYPGAAAAADCWPGGAYVDYVGTDVFDWYGGPDNTYPHTASGALDWAGHWQQTLTAVPGGLDWISRLSALTGKPVIIPEWGLDFHPFGGRDDTYFLTRMTAWLKAQHAIGLYWIQDHVTPSGWPGGPLLAGQGAAAQGDTPGAVNAAGRLLGGHLEYAGVYLPDREPVSAATARPVLARWRHTGYRLVLSADIVPNPPAIPSYSGPPQPHPYQLADYPDVVAILRGPAR